VFKKAIAKFLLGRGIGRLQEVVSKAIRHGSTTIGGALVADGLTTSNDVTTAAGALVTLAGFGLSIARTWLAERVSQ
jgi:hypothetical protein